MFSSESKMNLLKKFVFLMILFSGIMMSCDDPVPEPDPDEGKTKAPALTIKVNEFFKDVMTDYYFWYKNLPDIDVRYEMDSKAYFEKLKYKDDVWSWVTDDAKKLEDSFEGKETSYGWSLAFGRFSNTQTIFALVEFVYPGTPADKAGLKRGDMIFQMNGADIKDANYMDMLNSASGSFTFGQYTDTGISNKTTVSMTAQELNLDPVQFTKIIEHGGHKIGYFFYAQFVTNHNSSIDSVLQNFIDNQVTDVVIDLRYNPGGDGPVAQYFSSSLAPVNVVNEEKVAIRLQYNDKLQNYFESKNDQERLGYNFLKSVPVKMGLTKLHFITGKGTASASEFLIIALIPYMNVKKVGEATFGKYTGMFVLKPEYIYEKPTDYKDFENWAVLPIVSKYTNSVGFTDFKDGLQPDIQVEDDLLSAKPLGDKTEPMLKKAIEDITGLEVIAMKSARIMPDYTIFDRGFSKFDKYKRELLIDGINKDFLKQE